MDAPSYRESVRCRASLAGQGALTCPRPVRLSIVVTCTRSQGSKSLSCFPSMALSARRLPSLLRVPESPVPRSRRYYEGATTSHPRIHGRLLVRFHSPRDPPSFVSAVALPKGRRSLPGQAPLVPPGARFRRPRAWTRMGSLRSSGDPSRAFAPFQDPGRADVPLPLAVTSMLPPLSGRRRPRHWLISGLTRSFGTRCHTLHAWRCRHTCKACFRLAGSAFAGRESNHSGSLRKLSARFDDHPPFLLS